MPFRDVLGQPQAVELLRRGLRAGKLHHALLFFGPDGVGKERTAFSLACAIVCTVAPGEGCGACAACHRAQSGGGREDQEGSSSSIPLHPDVLVVERGLYDKDALGRSTDEKSEISVDQIRRVVLARLSMSPHEAPERTVIVRRAEELSIGAANALLKTLEEPPNRTRFVLITDKPGELLPTIRSRTLPVRFAALHPEVIEALLLKQGVAKEVAARVAPLSSGSMKGAQRLADPELSRARVEAAEALRSAASGSQAELLRITSKYGNTSDERKRLIEELEAMAVSEALVLSRLVRQAGGGGVDEKAERASIARYDAARALSTMLERNANAPLALEAAWLELSSRVRA